LLQFHEFVVIEMAFKDRPLYPKAEVLHFPGNLAQSFVVAYVKTNEIHQGPLKQIEFRSYSSTGENLTLTKKMADYSMFP